MDFYIEPVSSMEGLELDPSSPPCLYLTSAFFAMEPTDCLISLARKCGGGSITNEVQSLIWEHCINKAMSKDHAPTNLYVKNFLKKLILEVESSGDAVLDGLYGQFGHYIASVKDDILSKDNARACKTFSFLFPFDCVEVPSCPKSLKLEVQVQCSLNMLEGDTGCWMWPSGFYLSEFILSYPEIFIGKSCLEVGSGVGLVGISLALVKASKVILTDGDMSTLATLKLNLKLNELDADNNILQRTSQDTTTMKCKLLSWEFAKETDLQSLAPDIILGADGMYDRLSFPHLVRVLSILLKPKIYNLNNADGQLVATPTRPVAYIATVIRNIDTYNFFISLTNKADLCVVDITDSRKPLHLLPYMQSYDRSTIRLLTISRN